jgi:hypothetical protein
MIIIGLVILIAAVVAGVAGVLANSGSGHPLIHHFAVFGYHVTGSTGTLFLNGIVVGALGMLGLSLLLAGARRTSRRGREARHGLTQSRRETATVTQDRDDLRGQRETAPAYTVHDEQQNYTASTRDDDPAASGRGPGAPADGGRHSRWHLFQPRSAAAQPTDPSDSSGPSEPSVPAVNEHAPDVPADASVASD